MRPKEEKKEEKNRLILDACTKVAELRRLLGNRHESNKHLDVKSNT